VDLLLEENTENYYVRKTIYGVEQPLYQGIFTREIRALYKLNNCNNIVHIHSDRNMKDSITKEIVGCIYLEYIFGETLSKINLTSQSSKEKINILNQLLIAIEVAHSNGIIHRDINPNNIMISDQNNVKVIDFGICKIKEMVNNTTVYRMGTNLYSAPEVHLHSENATERSDLYSIGAVIYYLFTGKEPPIANEFKDVLDRTSGVDIELKSVIRKLVAELPNERYKDIYELKIDLKNVFNRFLNINLETIVSMDHDKFVKLKKMNLIAKNSKISDTEPISQNFSDVHAFKSENESYRFLGQCFMMECFYDEDLNIFRVHNFKKVAPIERERFKEKFAEISTRIQVIDPRFVNRLNKNDSNEIRNIIDAYCDEYLSKNNVDSEYKEKFGAWRKLLDITKASIEKNIVRLQYDSFSQKNEFLIFILKKGVFLENLVLNKEQTFVCEKPSASKKRLKPSLIGYYEDDYYLDEHVFLKIRIDRKKNSLPRSGFICIDYRKDLANVQRQLDALDTIEKEDYSCPFNLKRIISGIETPKTRVLENEHTLFNKMLDMSQQAAVKKALNSESLSIIQGPPGTGKTNVVIEIILQILNENSRNPDLPEKKILLVSQSHPAVDKVLDDLIEQSPQRPNLLRIGRDEKLNPEIKEEYGLSSFKEKWINSVRTKCLHVSYGLSKELGVDYKEFCQYYSELEKSIIIGDDKNNIDQEIINNFREKTKTQKKEKLRNILEVQRHWIDQLPQCDEVDLYIIKSTTIIAGTCTGFISNKVIRDADFEYLIIDEAAKATFPELAVSFNKAEKIIMVGDHKQLPPVLDNNIIKENKDTIDQRSLAKGIFEKLYEAFPEENKHRLTVQYRMHPAIGTLISHVFYDNEIQNGIELEKRSLEIEEYTKIAIEWLSTSSHSLSEKKEKPLGVEPQLTYRNDLEIKIIKEKLSFLDSEINRKVKVGVITAYSAQKYALTNMINQQQYMNLSIEVDTVDAFQGSQKEIIIYSTVRSSDKPSRIGFLRSEARLNVAFSRAQSLLIIVGDHKFLNNRMISQNRFPEIIDYIYKNDFCRIEEV
jgi:superfamily I DNA and/or RNA helicase